jgi:hypothetical protein
MCIDEKNGDRGLDGRKGEVRDRTTAFLTRVGGRAFKEAVGSCML